MSSAANNRSDSRTEDERSSHKDGSNKDQRFTEDDLAIFHERESGRIILDPEEARIEFGEEFTSRLKLTKDGKTILWPQPRDDPADPQNWSDRKKALHIGIITLATVIPNFDSSIGIATVFQLAEEYNTSTGHINNLTSNWSIFLIGKATEQHVMLTRRYGRLSVLFWTQVLALGFLVGATFAPTLEVFAAMRCLTGFFGTCPQITGLFVINDIFPFHLRARKIGIWTCAEVLGPHLSPFVFSFLVGRINYRWAWGIGCMSWLVVLLLIVFFVEETIYDRKLGVSIVEPGLKGRVKALIGMNASKISKMAPPWREIFIAPFAIVWRPHFFGICLLEAMVFGFSIGVNITNTIFFQSPPPFGFGFEPFTVAGIYATPVIAVFVGEVFGRYLNDWVMYTTVRRNQG
ncbi:MFS general substrate transporter, partial [Marasmius fiardii PR-910]